MNYQPDPYKQPDVTPSEQPEVTPSEQPDVASAPQDANPQSTVQPTPTPSQDYTSPYQAYQYSSPYQPAQPTTPPAQNYQAPNQQAAGYQPTAYGQIPPYQAPAQATGQTTGGSIPQYGQPPKPPHHPPHGKKKRPPLAHLIGIFVACAVISVACGFGGAYLKNYLLPEDVQVIDTTTVLTQSIVNESTDNSDVAAVAAATMNSVVEISTESTTTDGYLQQMVTEGAGSGVIVTEDGYIVTNYHVIEGATKITVTTKLGEVYEATLIGTDETTDLAVIKIDATGLSAAVFGNSDTLVVGELAVAIGNPLGTLGGTVTEGIISALDREITIDDQTYSLLQTTAAINSGNSGGGLFNSSGELIGIVNAKSSGTGIEGLGFAIPINTAIPVIEDLIEYGYVTGQVQLGVSLLAIEDEETAMMYRVSDLGVYIAQVTSNSDAYFGGLQVGDLIKTINGETIETTTQVKEMVSNSEVGDVLSFEIVRSDETLTIDITLSEYNSNLDQFITGS